MEVGFGSSRWMRHDVGDGWWRIDNEADDESRYQVNAGQHDTKWKVEGDGDRGDFRALHSRVHAVPLHDFIGLTPKPLLQAAKRHFEKHLWETQNFY